MTTDTSERGLERLICKALAGHPCDPPEAGFLQLIHMTLDVEQLLQRPVDLYTDGDLLAEQRERILQEAIPL